MTASVRRQRVAAIAEMGALFALAMGALAISFLVLVVGLAFSWADHGLWIRMALLAGGCIGVAAACLFLVARLAIGATPHGRFGPSHPDQ